MFKVNKFNIVLVSIVVLGIIVYLAQSLGQKEKLNKFSTFISPANVTNINIRKGENEIILKKLNQVWHVPDKDNMDIIADASKVLTIFDFVNDAKIIQKVTKKESSYSIFDLTKENETIIEITGDDSFAFSIGKTKDYSSSFVKKENDPYVYLVEKTLNLEFDVKKWFYKTILDYDRDMVDYISYNTIDKKKIDFFYEKVSNSFFVKNVPEGKETKDLTFLKNGFAKINVIDFLAKDIKEKKLLVNHKIIFKHSAIINLSFYEFTEKKDNKNEKARSDKKYFIVIDVNDLKTDDTNLNYIKKITDYYMFSISSFDPNIYHKKYDDFFEIKKDKPEENVLEDKAAEVSTESLLSE